MIWCIIIKAVSNNVGWSWMNIVSSSITGIIVGCIGVIVGSVFQIKKFKKEFEIQNKRTLFIEFLEEMHNSYKKADEIWKDTLLRDNERIHPIYLSFESAMRKLEIAGLFLDKQTEQEIISIIASLKTKYICREVDSNKRFNSIKARNDLKKKIHLTLKENLLN